MIVIPWALTEYLVVGLIFVGLGLIFTWAYRREHIVHFLGLCLVAIGSCFWVATIVGAILITQSPDLHFKQVERPSGLTGTYLARTHCEFIYSQVGFQESI